MTLNRLSNRIFFRLVELERASGALLEELNSRVMRHLGKSRRGLFEAGDRPVLKPLPERAYKFDPIEKATVNADDHVVCDKYYSPSFIACWQKWSSCCLQEPAALAPPWRSAHSEMAEAENRVGYAQ